MHYGLVFLLIAIGLVAFGPILLAVSTASMLFLLLAALVSLAGLASN